MEQGEFKELVGDALFSGLIEICVELGADDFFKLKWHLAKKLGKNLDIHGVSTRTCKTCRHRTKVQKEYEGKCIYNCLSNGYEVTNEHKCDRWQPN